MSLKKEQISKSGYVIAFLLLLSIISAFVLTKSIEADITSWKYHTNQISFLQEQIPLTMYHSFQSVYAQSGTQGQSPAVSNTPTDENRDAPPVKSPNIWITFFSLLLSLAIVFGIFVFVNYSLKSSNMKFSDILRDGSGFPSLARFQFLLWTFITLFAVLGVYFIRLFMGVQATVEDIPRNLLILTGISIAVPIVSNPISNIKYGERKPPTGTLTKMSRRRLATMLMENEKITVSRFQMFAWTIISIIVYLGFFFSETTVLLNDVNNLTVPDIPEIFVFLMGLSQVGYIGVKGTISKSLTVTQVIPNSATANEDVTIIGTNFGSEQGKVFFEDQAKEVAGKQVPVQLQDIKEWQDTRIVIKVPSTGLVAGTDYYIRVENNGLISYKGGGQDDEAKFTMQ